MNPTLKEFVRRRLPRRIKPGRILAGPLRGKRIVTSWHDYPAALLGRTERPLLDWFKQNVKVGETWLDIGAHYGYTAIALSKLVGPGGRVFAFEPTLATAGYLSQTRLINEFQQLQIIPLALAQPETLTTERLWVVRGMVDSTIVNGDWHETIFVARLDWLWPRICNSQQQIDGIKIDVQGMEIQTLQGMEGLLKKYRPKLVVEVHHGVPRDELIAILEAAGYSPVGVPIEGQELFGAQYLDDRSYAFIASAPT